MNCELQTPIAFPDDYDGPPTPTPTQNDAPDFTLNIDLRNNSLYKRRMARKKYIYLVEKDGNIEFKSLCVKHVSDYLAEKGIEIDISSIYKLDINSSFVIESSQYAIKKILKSEI